LSETTVAITHTLFAASDIREYRLYNSWIIDNAANVHVCNDASRSQFTKTRDPKPGELIYAGKTAYLVEAYGTVRINVRTGLGKADTGYILLLDVALTPGFITNLVSLVLLSRKQIY
jgi:hypothetical protein